MREGEKHHRLRVRGEGGEFGNEVVVAAFPAQLVRFVIYRAAVQGLL